MNRITISADSPDDLVKMKRIIAKEFQITRVKGPTVKENGRLNYYIFVDLNPKAVNNPS